MTCSCGAATSSRSSTTSSADPRPQSVIPPKVDVSRRESSSAARRPRPCRPRRRRTRQRVVAVASPPPLSLRWQRVQPRGAARVAMRIAAPVVLLAEAVSVGGGVRAGAPSLSLPCGWLVLPARATRLGSSAWWRAHRVGGRERVVVWWLRGHACPRARMCANARAQSVCKHDAGVVWRERSSRPHREARRAAMRERYVRHAAARPRTSRVPRRKKTHFAKRGVGVSARGGGGGGRGGVLGLLF